MNSTEYCLYRTTKGLFFYTTNLIFQIKGLRTSLADRSLRVHITVTSKYNPRPPYFIRTINLLNKKACETFATEYSHEKWLEASLMFAHLEKLTKELQKERQRIRRNRELKNFIKLQKNSNKTTSGNTEANA